MYGGMLCETSLHSNLGNNANVVIIDEFSIEFHRTIIIQKMC